MLKVTHRKKSQVILRQTLLEPEGVKFVLGPTPVQKQLMEKRNWNNLEEIKSVEVVQITQNTGHWL